MFCFLSPHSLLCRFIYCCAYVVVTLEKEIAGISLFFVFWTLQCTVVVVVR